MSVMTGGRRKALLSSSTSVSFSPGLPSNTRVQYEPSMLRQDGHDVFAGMSATARRGPTAATKQEEVPVPAPPPVGTTGALLTGGGMISESARE